MSLGLNITDWGAGLVKYLPGFLEWEHKPKSILRNMGIGKKTVKGIDIRQKVIVQQNTGVGYTDKEGALPVPGAQKFIDMSYGRKAIAGSARLTDYTMAQSEKGVVTVEDAMEGVLRSSMESVRWCEEFFMQRDGTGVVATVGLQTGGSGLGAGIGPLGTSIYVSDGRGFVRDGHYEIRDATGTTIKANIVVDSKVTTLTTGEANISIKAPALTAAQITTGDLVVWGLGGTTNASSYGKAVTGFQALFTNALIGTFQGIPLASYPEFVSLVFSNGGAAQNLSYSLIRNVLAAMAQRIQTGTVDNVSVVCSNWEGKVFEELGQGELRVTSTDTIGGRIVNKYQSAFGEYSLMTHPLSPYGVMTFCDRSSVDLQMVKEIDWRPATDSGGIFKRSDDNSSYVASLMGFYDMVCYARQNNAVIQNIVSTPLLAW
jgi:hypothetical protein